jgi:acylphosphatase
MTVARRLVIRGRVQGVNYRAFVADRAASRGVAGWAANQDDGSVLVWLEGDPEAVADVERAVRTGPPHAAVDGVDAVDGDPQGAEGFQRR